MGGRLQRPAIETIGMRSSKRGVPQMEAASRALGDPGFRRCGFVLALIRYFPLPAFFALRASALTRFNRFASSCAAIW